MNTLQKMFEHLYWANQNMLETLGKIDGGHHEANRLFSHILFAEKVWMTRLQGLDSSLLPIWSDVSMEVCAELVKQNEESIQSLFKNMKPTKLDKVISYKNSSGKEFHNSVREILTHVALHGQHHRGQINARLRADGFEPVNIDFISFVR